MAKNTFTELCVVEDVEGVIIAPITYCDKPAGRVFSFSIQKRYQDEGVEKRTSWLALRHLPAVARLLDRIEERMLLEQEKAKVVRPKRVG